MNALDKLIAQACQTPAKIVLPESSDIRILQAAIEAARAAVAAPVLLLTQADANSLSAEHGLDLGGLELVDPNAVDNCARWAEALHKRRAHKGMSLTAAQDLLKSPLTIAAIMCHLGEVDAVVAGALCSTADVVRTALQIVGVHPDTSLVSSFMLMLPPAAAAVDQQAVVFSDCGLVIDPNSEALTNIAIAAGHSAIGFLGEQPRVAMLSFSTAGSAKHAEVDKVQSAAERLKAVHPEWQVVGEVQFDAAWVPELLAQKAPDVEFQGPANVFVFPSLEAGNIAYKVAQRMGGWQMIGPFLQGLARPVNDLSRGCSADDVFAVLAGTSAQVAAESTKG